MCLGLVYVYGAYAVVPILGVTLTCGGKALRLCVVGSSD